MTNISKLQNTEVEKPVEQRTQDVSGTHLGTDSRSPFLLHKGSGIQRTHRGRRPPSGKRTCPLLWPREKSRQNHPCFPLLEKQDPTALTDHGRMLGGSQNLCHPCLGHLTVCESIFFGVRYIYVYSPNRKLYKD